jgi:hypothetical protein
VKKVMERGVIALTVAGLVILVLIGLMGGPRNLPPCEFEDSIGCFWDAKVQGNGHGTSFWVDNEGKVHTS